MNTFISIILSLIIAIAVTWYFTRKQMKKNEITHFSINSYDVGKGLRNVFPNFKLTYEGKEMSDEVLVLKGGFLNTGRNDITGLKNNSDIKLTLPDGCCLKEIQIRSLCSDLNVKACCSKETPNVINFGIEEKFMSGESFEYTAIIETKKEVKDLRRKIAFKHRIPNTSKIRNEYIIGRQSQHGSLSIFDPIKDNAIGMLSLMAALLMGYFSLSLLFQQKVQYYIHEKGTDKEVSVYITPKSQLYISDNEFVPFLDNRSITKEEINKKYNVAFKTNYSWGSDDSIIGIILIILAIVYFVTGLFAFYLWNRKKRIYQLFEQYEKE